MRFHQRIVIMNRNGIVWAGACLLLAGCVVVPVSPPADPPLTEYTAFVLESVDRVEARLPELVALA
jgi:hypothetical protein